MSGIYQVYTIIINFLGFPDADNRDPLTQLEKARAPPPGRVPGQPKDPRLRRAGPELEGEARKVTPAARRSRWPAGDGGHQAVRAA